MDLSIFEIKRKILMKIFLNLFLTKMSHTAAYQLIHYYFLAFGLHKLIFMLL